MSTAPADHVRLQPHVEAAVVQRVDTRQFPTTLLCNCSAMAWEWVAPAATATVALAGIGATLRTAAQGRTHAELDGLAISGHPDRLEPSFYVNGMREGIGVELQALLSTRPLPLPVMILRGEELTPRPAGAPLPLAPMDAITVRMRLLADPQVEDAWSELVRIWEQWQWWLINLWNGDPEEQVPTEVKEPLKAAIARAQPRLPTRDAVGHPTTTH